jgi:hypothetical protein
MNFLKIFGAAGALGALLAGCAGPGDDYQKSLRTTAPTDIGGVAYLDQGWKEDAREWYYYTSQGSRLLPYDWFMALTDAKTGKPVSGSLTDLGYLPPVKTKYNPDNLAVGFVKDGEGADAALGLTCAACHTNDLKVDNVTIRVDGAGVTGDLYSLLTMIRDSLDNVVRNDAAFKAFAAKVLGQDAGPAKRLELYGKVKDFRNKFFAFVKHSTSKTAWGAARTDAFGMIFNRVSAIDLKYPRNNRQPDAPVSYPHLWSAPQQVKNQWNGLVPNEKFAEAQGRNVGEVLGVFGEAKLVPPGFLQVGYDSSVRSRNLMDMEEQVRVLQAPAWPERILGAVNTEKAAEGKKLYDQACLSCHAIKPRNADVNDATVISLWPLFNYKVDPKLATATICSKGVDAAVKAGQITLTNLAEPKMAVDAACRTSETRQLAGVNLADIKIPIIKDIKLPIPSTPPMGPKVASATLLTHVVGGVILHDAASEPFTVGARMLALELKYKLNTKDQPALGSDPFVYKARPLNGVWATAPYMHNGSVPSLYEMLLPAEKRSKQFRVGDGAFDPKNVGLPTGPSAGGGFLFDTSLPANRNTGHQWGADWTDAQRRELIEYLKML